MPNQLNPFEQHVEKIVLGVSFAAVVGVCVLEFGLSESTVQYGGSPVPISSVDGKLEHKAQEMQSKLRDDAAPGFEFPSLKEPTSKKLETRLAGGIGRAEALPSITPRLASKLAKEGLAEESGYHELAFAAPDRLLVQSTSDALTDEAVSQFAKELEGVIAAGTSDIAWVTPSARLDLTAYNEELRASGPDDQRAIPQRWYDSRLLVVDVVFERQEQNDRGEWGPTSVVDPVGTQTQAELSFRADLSASPVPDGLRGTVLETLKNAADQEVVIRPDFYPTKRGLYSPPTEQASTSADPGPAEDPKARERNRLTDDVRKLEQRRVKLADELEDLGGRLDPPPKDRGKPAGSADDGGSTSDGGGGGGGGGFGFGGGGGMKGRRDPNAGKDAEKDKRRMALTRQVDQLAKQIQDARKKLEGMGVTAEQVTAQAKAIDLAVDEEVRVWTHDIRVQAGHTYRYRCAAKVLNPFLGKETVLTDAQQRLAKEAAVTTAVSGWSESYTVPSELAMFVTSANLRGRGEAKVEVYRLHDGQRRMEDFLVRPGDRIGEPKVAKADGAAVNYTTDWYVVDIFEDPASVGKSDASAAAIVVVQDISGKVMEYRVPASDAASSTLRSLKTEAGEADRARVASPTAAEPPPSPEGGGGGPIGGPSGGGPGG